MLAKLKTAALVVTIPLWLPPVVGYIMFRLWRGGWLSSDRDTAGGFFYPPWGR